MLARKINNVWTLWDGLPFQHPQHPEWGPDWKPSAPETWPADELAAAGLCKVTVVDPGPYDPVTQVKEGPVYTQDATSMTATFTVRSKTAQEIDDDKTLRIGGLSRDDLLTILLSLENDNRLIKAKQNVNHPGSWTAGQAAQITKAQLVTGLKALLTP
jgi:hypothetical protein